MKTKILSNAQRDQFIEYVQGKDVNCAYRAEFSRIIRPRTLSQNSYMWLCLAIAEQETGTDKGWFYQYYLKKFPQFKSVEIFGEETLIELSSSKFNRTQMSNFIDSLRNDLSENGIQTPDVDDKRLEEIFRDMQIRGLI